MTIYRRCRLSRLILYSGDVTAKRIVQPLESMKQQTALQTVVVMRRREGEKEGL